MFNLGIKQIIINSSDVVTSTGTAEGDVVTIDGFGKFTIGAPTDPGDADRGFVQAGAQAALGVYTVPAIAGAADGDLFDIRVYVGGTDRVIGEVWPYNSNSLLFQVVWDTDLGTSLAAAQVAGLNDKIVKFSGTTTATMTFQNGYQGFTVQNVTWVKSEQGTVSAVDQRETSLAVTTVTEGSEGINTGRILEATVRNATFENIDPYGIAFGGNDAVDVRGLYTEISWISANDHELGWEPHEMLGYGDANTTTSYAPRRYSAYCNEASAARAILDITPLAIGEVV